MEHPQFGKLEERAIKVHLLVPEDYESRAGFLRSWFLSEVPDGFRYPSEGFPDDNPCIVRGEN